MVLNTDEAEVIEKVLPSMLLWMQINAGYHVFIMIFNCGMSRVVNVNNIKMFQVFANLLILPDFCFSIWGCTIMFG